MYIGSTGYDGVHHLIKEIADNSIDEAIAGYATRVDVRILEDGGITITDDGRGILPISMLKQGLVHLRRYLPYFMLVVSLAVVAIRYHQDCTV